MVQIVTTHSK